MSSFAEEQSSPKLQARIAGVLYLIVIVTGGFAEFFTRAQMMVHGDAAATAANVAKSMPLFRLGLVSDLVGDACYLAVTVLLYYLLKPVNRTLSLLAAVFSFTGCAVLAANLVNHIAPILLLGGAPYMSAFSPAQIQVLVMTALRLHAWSYNLAMVFFGLYCLSLGYLVFRSTFLPRLVGILLAIAGLNALSAAITTFLAIPIPDFGLAGLIGEGSLALWLTVMGVNEAKWKLAAEASR